MPMTYPEVEQWLTKRGYARSDRSRDIWYKKDAPPTFSQRFRLTKVMLKLEGKTTGGEWIRLRSAYFAALSVSAEGKILGLVR